MYPNPQDVLPLPPRPSLEQYRKKAKDLVKACKSGDPDSIRAWTAQWIEGLAAFHGEPDRPRDSERIDRRVDEIAEFARTRLSCGQEPATCALTDAQFVMARVHGFLSWPKFANHLEALARASSAVSAFEAAADAIVAGDATTLARLLGEQSELIRARSTREHRATLLHYVSANGVENYRQRTPKNAVKIAEMLLEAGAEVDAQADVYGGGPTTLGLVATSVHPFKAGVQHDLIDILLQHGARMDAPGAAGNTHNLVNGCLANGRPEAAEYLVSRGAPLDLEGAAGVGRLDVVKTFFNEDRSLTANATKAQMTDGFAWACVYDQADVVEFLLEQGMEVDARLNAHGRGHTGLHVAAFHAHVETANVLLRRGAPVNVTDETWGTPPLIWALQAWSEMPTAPPERYQEVVAILVRAGAVVKPGLLDWDKARADPEMLAALTGALPS